MVLVIENSSITLMSLIRFFALQGYVLESGEDDTYNAKEITALEDVEVEETV